MTAIWWIRRDLRLTNNFPLHAALDAGSVTPVFIPDPRLPSRRAQARFSHPVDHTKYKTKHTR
jgi:deoxyribodipyrimidine photo-lyase